MEAIPITSLQSLPCQTRPSSGGGGEKGRATWSVHGTEWADTTENITFPQTIREGGKHADNVHKTPAHGILFVHDDPHMQ